MLFDAITINNTPVLAVGTQKPEYGRILGASKHKQGNFWMFPAYLPFLPKVLSDIKIVDPTAEFTEKAQQYLAGVKPYAQWRDEIARYCFPTRSRDHQLDGTAELLTYHRWMLQWGMGVGKTKIAIDTINTLHVPTLVLCPKVAVNNWILEIQKHGGGMLRAMTLAADSRKGKFEQLNAMQEHDVVITTYDTARIYGVPNLGSGATQLLVRAHRALPQSLRAAVMGLNDERAQERLVREWLAGRSTATVEAELAELRGSQTQWLMDWDYHMVICDESHRIKNIRSDRTGAVLKLGSKASRRILMSGTPIQGNPKDAFPQLKFLAPYILNGDYFAFCKQYVVYAPYDDKVVVGYKNLHILNRIINSVSSKRELAECVTLPEQTFSTVSYTLSSAQRKAYNKAIQEWTVARNNAPDMLIANAATGLSKLLQICSGFVYVQEDTGVCDTCPHVTDCIERAIAPGSSRCAQKDTIEEIPRETQWFPANPKLSATEDLLEDIVPTHKVIIWAVFTAELDLLEKSLQKQGLGYVRVDGNTVSNAAECAERFNTVPDCKVYLAQISTGISITLNAAKYMIYYSRDWSLDNRKQSAARNYRIGQTQKTVVLDLCAQDTVEVQQLEALNCKQNISELLTKKVDCALCGRYSHCVKNDIEPWDEGCVYKKTVNRVIAKAAVLEED